ncbi:MAG: hypothetical protein PHF00_06170, partial [Elusimicrobia bacterium]|nr:hypothetical protein [Elusimicrobiota bacterium]
MEKMTKLCASLIALTLVLASAPAPALAAVAQNIPAATAAARGQMVSTGLPLHAGGIDLPSSLQTAPRALGLGGHLAAPRNQAPATAENQALSVLPREIVPKTLAAPLPQAAALINTAILETAAPAAAAAAGHRGLAQGLQAADQDIAPRIFDNSSPLKQGDALAPVAGIDIGPAPVAAELHVKSLADQIKQLGIKALVEFIARPNADSDAVLVSLGQLADTQAFNKERAAIETLLTQVEGRFYYANLEVVFTSTMKPAVKTSLQNIPIATVQPAKSAVSMWNSAKRSLRNIYAKMPWYGRQSIPRQGPIPTGQFGAVGFWFHVFALVCFIGGFDVPNNDYGGT